MEGIYVAAGPGELTNMTRLADGSFSFTNFTDGNFPVFATTNVAQPFSNWTRAGFATKSPVGSGNFSFTDAQATSNPQRYYRVTSP